MAIRVNVESNPAALVGLTARIRQAELEAAAPILAEAVAEAPYEDPAKHPEYGHLRDSAYSRFDFGRGGSDRVVLGFSAFWARWQHERMGWRHTHGHAKFLELPVMNGAQAWRTRLADLIRKSFTS